MIFSDREKAIWRPPVFIPTKEWGEKNRELSALTSASAGRWSMDMIPFFIAVLDALDDEDVEIVVLQKSTQIAGTETFLTWMGKVADQDPGPAMMCFSDEDTTNEVVDRRLDPLFKNSITLAKLIDKAKFTKKSITLLNNFSLTPAWASSISKTASRPIRYLYLSEITKPGYGKVGDEGSVLTRIFQRTETFPNKKIAIETTPTIEGDNIDKQMGLCDVIFDHHVPCPKCGVHQILRFRPVKYRNSAGVEVMSGCVVWESKPEILDEKQRMRAEAETARYKCGDCGELWTTGQKNAAVSRGKSFPRTSFPGKPKRVGFHISRLYSLFPGGRLDALVLSFLQAKNDPEELQSFVNNSLAEHWKPYKITSDIEELKKAKCGIQAGIVPDIADAIIVTVDMQQTYFWYLVRAWSSRLKDSWLIECGQVADWEDIDELFFEKTWKKADGKEFGCWRGALDIGGTKEEGKDVSRTEEAESWWIQNRRRAKRKIFLCKGSSRSMPTKISIGKILETTPSGKKIAHGGLQIIELNTPVLKDLFFHAIDRAAENASGAAYLNDQIPDSYFRHITAEAKDNDGNYVKIGKDNHLLDCEMQQFGMISRELFGGIDRLLLHHQVSEQRQNQSSSGGEMPNQQEDSGQKNPYLDSGGSDENPYIQR
jgi:terminase, large subunit